MTAKEAVGNALDRLAQLPTVTIDGTLERIKRFVADVNSTNLVITTGLCIGVLTALVYFATMLLQRPPEQVTFGLFLGFVASWIGFGVRQFRVKRETHKENGPQGSGAPSGTVS